MPSTRNRVTRVSCNTLHTYTITRLDFGRKINSVPCHRPVLIARTISCTVQGCVSYIEQSPSLCQGILRFGSVSATSRTRIHSSQELPSSLSQRLQRIRRRQARKARARPQKSLKRSFEQSEPTDSALPICRNVPLRFMAYSLRIHQSKVAEKSVRGAPDVIPADCQEYNIWTVKKG